jgi:undecaprenyl diphosphate synthase
VKQSSASASVPRHVAIIMDGNGRWAAARALPRAVGHRMGARAVRRVIEANANAGVEVLTLFAFSSENWRRPKSEVDMLMSRFVEALDNEVDDLNKNRIRLRFIGQRAELASDLQARMASAEQLTGSNDEMTVVVAIAYGGRWDIAQAARRLAAECQSGKLAPEAITEEMLGAQLELRSLPEPDLLIRTGGDQRISNFLLWNFAYTELYFCETLWPDFGADELKAAFDAFASRQRRYGLAPSQVEAR